MAAGNGNYVAVLIEKFDPMFGMADEAGYVLEHRLVMARYLGRPLYNWETVHHLNDHTKDNILTNLQLRIGNHGSGVCLKCAHCGSNNLIPVEI